MDRRDFLKRSVATAAAGMLSSTVNAVAVDSPTSDVSVWITAGSQRHQPQPALRWTAARSSGNQITIDPSQEYQELLGFGAAFTDAACYTFSRLDASVRKEIFQRLFNPREMGLSVGRVCIGASDYSRSLYSYCDGSDPDPELTRFSVAHDRDYILPILREARAANPDLWLLASPWSPPGWMKFNGSMLGGSMRRKYLGVYARYIDKFLAAYQAEGVRINSVTPQNEVDTDQDGRMPACIWPQEYEIEFVRDHLGPLLARSSNPADIWILDHNYNLWGRAMGELEDARARQFIRGIAWHGYAGTPDGMTRVKDRYPNLDMFWTEGGPDFEKPGYETEWCKWSATFTDILRNRARAVIGWNYALDETGAPNIGPFKCAGLVTVHSTSRNIVFSGQYWAMEHFARHIPRGARIVASTGDLPGVSHLAARGPDGTFSVVLTNAAKSETDVSIGVGSSLITVALPQDSVATLSWR